MTHMAELPDLKEITSVSINWDRLTVGDRKILIEHFIDKDKRRTLIRSVTTWVAKQKAISKVSQGIDFLSSIFSKEDI